MGNWQMMYVSPATMLWREMLKNLLGKLQEDNRAQA